MSFVAGDDESRDGLTCEGKMPTSLSLCTNEKGTVTAFIPGQGLVNQREKPVFVIWHSAFQIKVIGVVIAVQTSGTVEVI